MSSEENKINGLLERLTGLTTGNPTLRSQQLPNISNGSERGSGRKPNRPSLGCMYLKFSFTIRLLQKSLYLLIVFTRSGKFIKLASNEETKGITIFTKT